MPAVRLGPKHQVTIPQSVRAALHLSAGDFLDAAAEGGPQATSHSPRGT